MIKYRQLKKQVEETEVNLKKFAEQLAITSDCLNQAKDKEQEYITGTATFTRKAEFMQQQIEQERADKQIIIDDLGRMHKVKEKLVMSGKSSYKQRVDRTSAYFSDKDTQYFTGRDKRMNS